MKTMRLPCKDKKCGCTEVGVVATLRTELAVARERSDRLHERSSRFTVIGEYEECQKEADVLTRRLRELRDADVIE